jgi:hypothetical protein
VDFSCRSLLVVVSFVVVAAVAVVAVAVTAVRWGGGVAWFACGDDVIESERWLLCTKNSTSLGRMELERCTEVHWPPRAGASKTKEHM